MHPDPNWELSKIDHSKIKLVQNLVIFFLKLLFIKFIYLYLPELAEILESCQLPLSALSCHRCEQPLMILGKCI